MRRWLTNPTPVAAVLTHPGPSLAQPLPAFPPRYPVLVIDEANTLRSWEDKFPLELAGLFRSLVMLSKERNKAHVILASGDSAFDGWVRTSERAGVARVFSPSMMQRGIDPILDHVGGAASCNLQPYMCKCAILTLEHVNLAQL